MATSGPMPAAGEPTLDVVLEPLSRADLGDIRVDGVLAVGRTEQPFARFAQDILTMLSRRHARIFCEGGAVYVTDLGSRNGTTVNRDAVGPTPCRLNDGDEIGFGGVLSYRVRIAARAAQAQPESFALTLTPESAGAGLEAIVITRFPFLVSKSDPLFARYQADHAKQVGFLSRRHAHIFRKGGGACIEDLASTNGTFVDGMRLQEHAVPLHDGMLVAFGGEHFTYRVGIRDAAGAEWTPPPARRAAPQPAARDKTTFVAAPTSFLEIFCPDDGADAPAATDAPAAAEAAAPEAQATPARRVSRNRSLVLMTELAAMLVGSGDGRPRRWWRAAAVVAVLAALVTGVVLWGSAERALKDAMARGDYAQASALADQRLQRDPDDADLRAFATDAALKAHVPAWLAKLRERDFDGARDALARLAALAAHNPDLRPLLDELRWLGDLEQLVATRGGPDAPIRIYRDEDRIAALIGRWNDNTGEHQRALARIASYVPQFGEPYAQALTRLRRLQSDATVYLAAIERLKSGITAALKRDDPQSIEPLLKETGDKYPALGGLDVLRRDLAQYIAIRDEARTRSSARLFVLLADARFATPPLQDAFRALAAGRQLPPRELVEQYGAATRAWQAGRVADGIAGLQALAAGPWADAVAREVARRQGVAARYAALRQAGAAGQADQLLAFRAALDPEQDGFFAQATQPDVEARKGDVLARAQDAMNRARALWEQYRGAGAIDARQRIETTLSAAFRERARLLGDAARQAQQARDDYAQVDAAVPPAFDAVGEQIRAELEQQRSALQELRNVLDAGLLQRKLALLGGAR
ncbi:MAG: FHA domain-containing protein [Ideonella sp.]|nr:FHA domain-containing protein [Ideonella sp.]MCC7455489.1 FHA domain-containing protein [Nitrospira sp.]